MGARTRIRAGIAAVWVLLLSLSGLLLAAGTPAAAATAEKISHLEASFDIHPDGTMSVRYRLDWDFGQAGRHGLDFNILTSEPWEPDLEKQVSYDVTGLQVSSPTGAPAQFTEKDSLGSGNDGIGIVRGKTLRIGDPNTALKTSKETYEISYDLAGALRTTDGHPQFRWDLLSAGMPAIDSATFTITTPTPFTRVECAKGRLRCEAPITQNQTKIQLAGLTRGTAVSVNGDLPPGAVSNSEPHLTQRKYDELELRTSDTTITVGAEAVAHVQQKFRLGVPADSEPFRMSQPTSLPENWWQLRRFIVSEPQVTASDGTPWPLRYSNVGNPGDSPDEEVRTWTFTVPPGEQRIEEVTVAWEVRGAVVTSGDTARFAWPVRSTTITPPGVNQVHLLLPGAARSTDCRTSDDRGCSVDIPATLDGNRVSFTWDRDTTLDSDDWFQATLPAASVAPSAPITEFSPHLLGILKSIGIIALGVVGLALFGWVGVWLAELRTGTPDRRFAALPPGVIGKVSSDAITTERRRGEIPVRFSPPDCSLLQAGALLHSQAGPAQLSALLVHQAAAGQLQIRPKPLTVVRTSQKPESRLDRALWSAANPPGDTAKLEPGIVEVMLIAIRGDHNRFRNDRSLFQEEYSDSTGKRIRIGIAVVAVIAVVASFSMVTAPVGVALFLCLLGLLLGLWMASDSDRAALEPRGVALTEQIEGFRRYLKTAEAHQLEFEAGRDIYREFLPWAVLLGLSKRWTKVCQKMAASGRIPEPRLEAIGGGVLSAGDLSRTVSSLSDAVSSGSSSSSGGGDGFGGSSGSGGGGGGFSGGGGGGGVSASSW